MIALEALTDMMKAWGIWGLIITAFTEASFFIIPPDVVLYPLAYIHPGRAFWYAGVTVLFSVLGAGFGYLLGKWLGKPVLYRFVSEASLQKGERLLRKYGVATLIIAGITPVPFKIFAILGGVFHMPPPLFFIGAFIGRLVRFFPVSVLIFFFGDEAERYLSNETVSVISLLSIPAVLLLFFFLRKKKHA